VLSTLEAGENPFPAQLTYLNLVFEDGEDEDLSPHLEVHHPVSSTGVPRS